MQPDNHNSVANSLATIIAQGQLVGTNTQQSYLVQLLLDTIPTTVETTNFPYTASLQNTLLDIYNVIFTAETFR